MAVTMRDVARRARVSTKTVSNVVNRHPHVHEGTRARVERAIAELGYRPNLSARGLRSGRSGVIGLVLPGLRRPGAAELADAVLAAAEEHDLGVVVSRTGGDRRREAAVLTDGIRQADGLLLSPEALGAGDRALLDQVDHPVVLVGGSVVGAPTDHVTTSDVAVAAAAVDHLLGRGRRRVALVGAGRDAGLDAGLGAGLGAGTGGASPPDPGLRGYRQALEAAGAPHDPRLVVAAGPWRPDDGVGAIRALVASGVPFDAVLALDDALALGVLRALGELGRRVPQDVAVIGVGDAAGARLALPALSTVDPGWEEVATTAVAMLVERVDAGDALGPPRSHEAAPRVLARGSTGDPGA